MAAYGELVEVVEPGELVEEPPPPPVTVMVTVLAGVAVMVPFRTAAAPLSVPGPLTWELNCPLACDVVKPWTVKLTGVSAVPLVSDPPKLNESMV